MAVIAMQVPSSFYDIGYSWANAGYESRQKKNLPQRQKRSQSKTQVGECQENRNAIRYLPILAPWVSVVDVTRWESYVVSTGWAHSYV